jgi:predicted DCC family thiol-disulfide oxidoreductase YuxK
MPISVNTEITDNDVKELNGWVLFDGACSLCTASARFFSHTLDRHGFAVAPLQTPWVCERLGLREGGPLPEMRALLANGDAPGGADAILEIARRIWWGWPFFFFAKLPGIKPALRAVYRIIAANRHCANGTCNLRESLRWFDWLPLIVLPTVIIALQRCLAPWVFMWALAAGIFMGCKWMTWRKAGASFHPNIGRSFAYFFAWPGMDAAEFLREKKSDECEPSKRRWLFAAAKAITGFALILFAARGALEAAPLATGWIGMLGVILLLHFGLFELVALSWQTGGVDAKPVMQSPTSATSLAEFWSRRWNTAFNVLVHDLVFRPLARKFGVTSATLGVFLISGILHDLVISLPARAGFGLPTAYFLFQGVAVLAERTMFGCRIGLGKGFRGWLFTLVCAGGPAFWLFHPPFVTNVILPMLRAISAN